MMDTYCTQYLGGSGEDFARLVAMNAFLVAALGNWGSDGKKKFKLALEFKDGGVFDDVSFFDENKHQCILIQMKHSAIQGKISLERLFPDPITEKTLKEGLAIVRYIASFSNVGPISGYETKLVLFTNMKGESIKMEQPQVNVPDVLEFVGGEHTRLAPEEHLKQRMQHFLNEDFQAILWALGNMFCNNDNRLDKIIEFKKFLFEVLKVDGDVVKFHEKFTDTHGTSEIHTLYNNLREDFNKYDLSILNVKCSKRFTEQFKSDYRDPMRMPNENDMKAIRQSIFHLFIKNSDMKYDKLREYGRIVSEVFVNENGRLKFRKDFSAYNPSQDIRELFSMLQKYFTRGEIESFNVRCEGEMENILRLDTRPATNLSSDALSTICTSFYEVLNDESHKVLVKYGNIVKQVLKVRKGKIKFHEKILSAEFTENFEFCVALQKHFGADKLSSLEVEYSAKHRDIFKNDTNHPLLYVTEKKISDYFDRFELYYSQPGVEEIAEAITEKFANWMKTWIPPDVFRKLSKVQLEIPFNVLKGFFREWEQPEKSLKTRFFLTDKDGEKFLEKVKSIFQNYIKIYDRPIHACERYCMNRLLKVEVEGKNEKRAITVGEFLDEITRANKKFYSLYAEPELGKSLFCRCLAFRAQIFFTKLPVFHVFLSDFKDRKLEISNFSEALEALKEIISDENIELIKQEENTILMFLDAYDSLNGKNKDWVHNFVEIMTTSKPQLKIFLCSRDCCRQKLSHRLRSLSTRVMLLETQEHELANFVQLEQFLRKNWNVNETTEGEEFHKFFGQLMKKLQDALPSSDYNFLGLLLTFKMAAEVYWKDFEKYLQCKDDTIITQSDVHGNVISLLEQYIRKLIISSLDKAIRSSKFLEVIIKFIEEKYTQLAIDSMNGRKLLEVEDLNLIKIVGDSPRFISPLFPAYFVAKYLFAQFCTASRDVAENEVYLTDSNICWFYFKILDFHSIKENSPEFLQYHLENFENLKRSTATLATQHNCGKLLSYMDVDVGELRDVESTTSVSGRATLLQVGAEYNACHAVEALLQKQRDKPIVEDSSEQSLLATASRCGHTDMVKMLVQNPVSRQCCSQPVKDSSLYLAAANGHPKVVRYLLDVGAIIDSTTGSNAWTPLHVAAWQGVCHVVELLIEKGADTQARTSQNQTPMELAEKQFQKLKADPHRLFHTSRLKQFIEIINLLRKKN